MIQAMPVEFLDWTNNHLLVVPANSPEIPIGTFKVLPKFEGMGKTLYEHCQDISHLVLSFNIINETMMTHSLAHSFEGKVAK